MKRKNYVILLLLAFLLSPISLIMGSQFAAPGDSRYNRLVEIASEKGFIRVIVKMDVPDIEVLTAVSGSFQTGITDISYIQQAAEADIALGNAISTAKDSVLYQLNGTPFIVNRTFSTLPIISLTATEETLERLKCIPEVSGIAIDEAVPLTDEKYLNDLVNGKEIDISEPTVNTTTTLIGARTAWGYGYTGAGWYVAIIDTGIRTTHNMFKGKTIIEQCFASGSDWDGPTGDCPNGQKEMSGAGSARHYRPEFYHGTHVAGIATGNDSVDNYYGIAKDANIIAINVFSYFPSQARVMSWNTDQLEGLEYLYLQRNNYKIAAANMSLGGGEETTFCDNNILTRAIDNLKSVGIATTISSGNEAYCGAVAAPACNRNAISVSGTDKQDHPYSSGNWDNNMVALLAPGLAITSAGGESDTQYVSMSGTSMSAPHVAGAWAIMKQFNEGYSVDQILTVLKNTGIMINSYCAGLNPKPRLNVGTALESLFTIAPPKNLSVEQVENKSLLQTEYINVLTWEDSPYNSGKNISQYKVYLVQNSQKTLLTQVGATTHTYLHRKAVKEQSVVYSITSVDSTGNESPGVTYTYKK